MIAGDVAVGLPPKVAEIANILVEAMPQLVTKERIMAQLYLLDEAEIKIIDVFICHLRRAIEGMPLEIRTEWGKGYRMIYRSESEIEEVPHARAS